MDLFNNQTLGNALGMNGGGFYGQFSPNTQRMAQQLGNVDTSGYGSYGLGGSYLNGLNMRGTGDNFGMLGKYENEAKMNFNPNILNGQNVGQAINSYEGPMKTAAKGGGSSAFDLALLGANAIVPGLGLGLQAIGGISDYIEGNKQQAAMEEQLNRQRLDRDYSRQKHLSELNRDASQRQLAMRGQIANSPYYQAQLGRLGQQYGNTSRMNADSQQKLGMGGKSGMSAQLASQAASNIGSQATQGAVGALGGLNRAYGSLGGKSQSSQPEIQSYALGNKLRDESMGYGDMFSGLMDLGTTSSMYGFDKGYKDYLGRRVDEGYGIGKSGGN